MGARGHCHSEQSSGEIITIFFINNGAKRGEVKIPKAMALSENVLLI